MSNDKKQISEEQVNWVDVAEHQKSLVKLESAFVDEERNATLIIGKRLGRKEIVQSLIKLLTVSDLLDLNHIKEAKAYKGYKHIDDGGKLLIISSWDDYCRMVEGRSRQIIDEELMNLKVLGPELFDSLRSIGIGSGIMRDIRALPADDQVVIAEVAKTDDKNALMDMVHEMSLKHERDKKKLQQDKDELTKQLEQVKAETEAKSTLLAKKDEKLNELDTELTRRTSPTVNVHLLERQEKERNALSLLHDTSNIAIAAVQKFHRDILSVAEFSDIGSVGEEINNAIHHVYQRIAQVSVELGIQVDFQDMVNPSWAQPLDQDD